MPVVLVHGVPESAALWRPLREALAARGVDGVVTLSPPGFGAPTSDGWAATMSDYRRWLIDELERIDGPIDLVGHDWGAGHVFGAVTERPASVRSYAADCLGLVHPDYVWHDMAQAWQTPEIGEQTVALLTATPTADRVGLFEGFGAPHDVAVEMADAADDEMARCILALYRSAAQPAAAETGARLLAAARPPGLGIIASDDPYVSADLCVDMARRLGVDEVVLDGAGHWWMFDATERAADALVAFWHSLPS